MNRFALIAGTCMLLTPGVVAAQSRTPMPAAAATPAVGATVYDSAGVEIGTIASITPQAIVLSVGTTKIAVPPTSVGATAKGLAMAMTKADLEAAQAQQQAAAQAAVQSRLVAGAPVTGLNGAALGTIKSASGNMVTLTTPKGDVQLPSSGFTANATGQLVLGLTQTQIDAALGAGGSAAPTGADASTSTGAAASTTSTGVAGSADATGTTTMTPPATTTTPTPKATATTATKTTMKKKTTKPM